VIDVYVFSNKNDFDLSFKQTRPNAHAQQHEVTNMVPDRTGQKRIKRIQPSVHVCLVGCLQNEASMLGAHRKAVIVLQREGNPSYKLVMIERLLFTAE